MQLFNRPDRGIASGTAADRLVGLNLLKNQIAETKAYLLPLEYQEAMVKGGMERDWFESAGSSTSS